MRTPTAAAPPLVEPTWMAHAIQTIKSSAPAAQAIATPGRSRTVAVSCLTRPGALTLFTRSGTPMPLIRAGTLRARPRALFIHSGLFTRCKVAGRPRRRAFASRTRRLQGDARARLQAGWAGNTRGYTCHSLSSTEPEVNSPLRQAGADTEIAPPASARPLTHTTH